MNTKKHAGRPSIPSDQRRKPLTIRLPIELIDSIPGVKARFIEDAIKALLELQK